MNIIFKRLVCVVASVIIVSGCAAHNEPPAQSVQESQKLSTGGDGQDSYEIARQTQQLNLTAGRNSVQMQPNVSLFRLDDKPGFKPETIPQGLRNDGVTRFTANGIPIRDPDVVLFSVESGQPDGQLLYPSPTNDLAQHTGRSMSKAGTSSASVFFDHGSSSLSAGDKAALSDLVAAVKNKPNLRISVEGHASKRAVETTENQRYLVNLKMSVKRMESVIRVLLDAGVPHDAIRAVAWSSNVPNPFRDGGMDEETANRRVEVYIQ